MDQPLMDNKRMRNTILLAGIVLLLSGCITQIIEASQSEKKHAQYSEYIIKTQQINIERESAHLAPVQVMTFNQWNHQ